MDERKQKVQLCIWRDSKKSQDLFWSNISHQKFIISLLKQIVYFHPVKNSHGEPKREDTSTAAESVPSRSWQRLPLLEICIATALQGTKTNLLKCSAPSWAMSAQARWFQLISWILQHSTEQCLSEGTGFSWGVTQCLTNKTQLESGPELEKVPLKDGVKWKRKNQWQDSKMLGQSRRMSSWCIWVDTAEIWGNLGEDGVIKSQERQKWEEKEWQAELIELKNAKKHETLAVIAGH